MNRPYTQPFYIFDLFNDKWEHYVSSCQPETLDGEIISINRDN